MMKTLLLSLAIICYDNLNAQTTAIPDPEFEWILIDLGVDTGVPDGSVSTSSIDTITHLYAASGTPITDLTGIEDFTSLKSLMCAWNDLTSLDLSQNLQLDSLVCDYNYNLNTLNVSQNTELRYLHATLCAITSVELTQASELWSVWLGGNQLSNIDLSNNSMLTFVDVGGNNLTSLDLSNNPLMDTYRLAGNHFTCLNVKNGNNANYVQFSAVSNPNLDCIEVDDAVWATANWTIAGANIDPASSFSTNCPVSCNVSLSEQVKTDKKIVRITDFLGRETLYKPNTVLIYIYSDGSTDRVFNIE